MKLLLVLLQYGARRRIGKLFLLLLTLQILPVAATAAPVTIAALGDSLTQGYGLPDGDGLVPQLQKWLTARGEDVVIVNAGVSGDTTAGGLARVGWTLAPGISGLIVALGGNDILRGIDPAVSRKNLDGILQTARDRGIAVLLVGLKAPTNFGADYKRAFDSIYPDLAAKYQTLLYPSYLSALTDGRDRQEVLQKFMQPDGIHPNAAGVALIVQAFGPSVAALIARARAAR